MSPPTAVELRGISRIDHLADALAVHGEPLKVVLCTKDEVFDDVPVRVWHMHGRFKHDSPDHPEHSQLLFDIPDEVWRRVQSRYATRFKQRHFNVDTEPCDIAEAIRTDTDGGRGPSPRVFQGDGFTTDVIDCDDWDAFSNAVEMCCINLRCGGLGGPKILFHGDYVGYAEIVGDQLRLNIGKAVKTMEKNWQKSVRQELGLEK